MSLTNLTSRQAVLDAVAEYDQLGQAAFLEKYGYGMAREYFLVVDGHEYDSKAIVGAAHGFQFPDEGPLQARDFSGGYATVQRLLESLGFVLRVAGHNASQSLVMDESAFDEAMMQIYVRARDEVGYNAARYLQMLHDHRGIETARILINAAQPSEGYTALWERGRLDLTVEALVLRAEWQDLFALEPELLGRARKRLGDYGYNG